MFWMILDGILFNKAILVSWSSQCNSLAAIAALHAAEAWLCRARRRGGVCRYVTEHPWVEHSGVLRADLSSQFSP